MDGWLHTLHWRLGFGFLPWQYFSDVMQWLRGTLGSSDFGFLIRMDGNGLVMCFNNQLWLDGLHLPGILFLAAQHFIS